MRFPTLINITLCFFAINVSAQTAARRGLTADDSYRMQEVSEPRVSPDGKFIAYTVSSNDRDNDKRRSAIWMVSWDGSQDVQLTRGPESAESPRWSPDGKYLAFTMARPEDSKDQVWVLDRRGGEARQLTHLTGELDSYEWSPDGKRLAIVMSPGDDDSGDNKGSKEKAPKPIVIDRYRFKADVEGYLSASSLKRIYLFDTETGKLDALTTDSSFDQNHPSWSPDGAQIAFITGLAHDPDQTGTTDIVIADARPGSTPRKLLTIFTPNQQRLSWSPDGKTLAFLQGAEPKYYAYIQDRLAVVPVTGGEPRLLTVKIDRAVANPHFTPDGSALTFTVEDDRLQYLAEVPVNGGAVERISKSNAVLSEPDISGGHVALIAATDTSAPEVHAFENGDLRKLTAHNDPLLNEIKLGAVEDISFPSKDKTEIHGLIVKPPDYQAGKKYPTLLWIHGGPNGQDDHSLDFSLYPLQMERQFFATHGYVVLAINYRGSSGRGAAFARSILADWGDKEVADLLAGVDYAIKQGIADPERLGVGGWSYGGILTDYTIATDSRFKAAISGAGSANQLATYGSDEYAMQYENELGPPWRNLDVWLKVSYPFFHADRIHTPTLFMGGLKDFNVPISGGEQMYQALRTLGVTTELVAYPGQYHLFTRPSYIHDRLQRYLAWFDRYLKK
ncbi:MAG TPA: S9 family peptidase [Terriglobales bacterium]|nr:S9 family peptidase [Terriglobales bacterium]